MANADLCLVHDLTRMKNCNLSEQKRLISRREAAEMLAVNPRTISRYERQGRLKPIKLSSRTTRYDLADVIAFIANAAVSMGGAQ
jgi:predicted DNA-binding transcriptional regulator AlpA